jgi:4-oxalocrotonate tautomerase
VPFITVKMLEGRNKEQKRKVVEGITRVIMEACEVTADRVYIFLEDLPKDHYARGGVIFSEKDTGQ